MNFKPNMLFLNRSFDKKRLKALLLWFRLNLSENAALKAVEVLQGLGFRSATQGAISLGLDDLKTPTSKGGRVFQAQVEVALAHHEHHRGNRTPVELFQHLVDTWHRTSQDLTTEVVQLFHSTERVNPVYMMAFSGARGNISQVRQLVGMRGLMADPRGQIVGFPILSNFREGLTITEYFVSCYGARKGVVDTAIRTADAGYLTRRLADVSHHVVVRTTNCGTHESILLRDIKEGQKTILSLANRLVGRVLAEHVLLPASSAQTLRSSWSKTSYSSPDLLAELANEKKACNPGKVIAGEYEESEASGTIQNSYAPMNLQQNFPCAVARDDLRAVARENSRTKGLTSSATQAPEGYALKGSVGLPLANLKVHRENKTKIRIYRNSEITSPLAEKLAAHYLEIPVRSPLSCSLPWGVCQLCYGWGLSEGRRVTLGEAVGIIAAQSIGEPGTQLTLRTFHTGGVFSGELLNEIRAPYNGKVSFPTPLQGLLLRTPHGQIAFLAKVSGKMKISETEMQQHKEYLLQQHEEQVDKINDITQLSYASPNKSSDKSPSLNPLAKQRNEMCGLSTCKGLRSERDLSKQNSEFLIQPSTVIFVKQKEHVVNNQLLAEFSSSTLQSVNDQIEITQQVLSDIAGQIWFKELEYGNRKGPGSGSLGTYFSSQKLGGIWVLAGKPMIDTHPSFASPLHKSSHKRQLSYCAKQSPLQVAQLSYASLNQYKSTICKKIEPGRGGLSLGDLSEDLSGVCVGSSYKSLTLGLPLRGRRLAAYKSLNHKGVSSATCIARPEKVSTEYNAKYLLNFAPRFAKESKNSETSESDVTLDKSLKSFIPLVTIVRGKQKLQIENNISSNISKKINALLRSPFTLQVNINSYDNTGNKFTSQIPRLPLWGNATNNVVIKRNEKKVAERQLVDPTLRYDLLQEDFIEEKLQRNNEVLNPLQVAQLSYASPKGLRLGDLSGASFAVSTLQIKDLLCVNEIVNEVSPTSGVNDLITSPSINIFTNTNILLHGTKISFFNNCNRFLVFNNFVLSNLIRSPKINKSLLKRKNLFKYHIYGIQNRLKRSKNTRYAKTYSLPLSGTSAALEGMSNVWAYPFKVKASIINLEKNSRYSLQSSDVLKHDYVLGYSQTASSKRHIPSISFSCEATFQYNFNAYPKACEAELPLLFKYRKNNKFIIYARQQRDLENQAIDKFVSNECYYPQTAKNSSLVLRRKVKRGNGAHPFGVKKQSFAEVNKPVKALRIITLSQYVQSKVTDSSYKSNSRRIPLRNTATYCKSKSSASMHTPKGLAQLSYSSNAALGKVAKSWEGTAVVQHRVLSRLSNTNRRFSMRVGDIASPCITHHKSFDKIENKIKKTISIFQELRSSESRFILMQNKTRESSKKLDMLPLLSESDLVTFVTNYGSAASDHTQYKPNAGQMLFRAKQPAGAKIKADYLKRPLQGKRSWQSKEKLAYHTNQGRGTGVAQLTPDQSSIEPARGGTFSHISHSAADPSNAALVKARRFSMRVGETVKSNFISKNSLENVISLSSEAELCTERIPVLPPLTPYFNKTSFSFSTSLSSFKVFSNCNKSYLSTILINKEIPRDNRKNEVLALTKNNSCNSRRVIPMDCFVSQGNKSSYFFTEKRRLQSTWIQKKRAYLTYLNQVCSIPLTQQFTKNTKGYTTEAFTNFISRTNRQLSTFNNYVILFKNSDAYPKSQLASDSKRNSEGTLKELQRNSKGVVGTNCVNELCCTNQRFVRSVPTEWNRYHSLARNTHDIPSNAYPKACEAELVKDCVIPHAVARENPLRITPRVAAKVTSPTIARVFPGQLVTYGDNITSNIVTTESGQVLYIDSQKTTVRKAQTVLIYSQAIIAVLSGDWIKKGTPLMSLSYQKLVTGDIVQGLPKIEQFFEAPVLRDGTFWSDSLQAKLNQFFQEEREKLPLAEAVRKGFSEIQRVLVEGVLRVYISQGVLIADKHLEVIVRQMTCKGRILYSGDTGFLRNELVSLDKIENVNQVTYGQKALYHPQVRGITDASLESESFLSAASFQETTRVLSRDAIIGKTDLMRGLKERVIVGELIQAGTGLANNSVYNLLAHSVA